MANIKNFGLVGVGSGVQFGKGGSQLIQTSGTFAAKNAAGTAFVRFQIADGAGSDDAITFNQLTNAVALVDSNAAAIQSELDATQLGAGLNPDGSYTPGTSNYLAGANSLANAAILLDAALFAETTARTAADLALADAVANAGANTSLIQAELDTVEQAVGLGSDGTLTLTSGNYLASATDIVTAVEILDSQLGITNANAAILDGRVDDVETNVAALQVSVSGISSDIDDLTARVGIVESNTTALAGSVDGLRHDVDANSALLLDTISSLQQTQLDLGNTNSNAVTLEGRVSTTENGLAAEITRATGAEGTLTTNLAAETAARIQGDSDLSNAVANTVQDIDNLSNSVLLKDGTVAMTGDLDLGNHNIVNLADPTTPFEAATKNYVDASIGTLSGAFLYQGTVTPGVDANSAVVMNAVAEPGWYYKATGDGYLIGADDGAMAFQVFANDGVVRNNSGGAQGWDVLGAVQFQIGAGDSSITVGGSVDTGYQVSVSAAYTAARQLEVTDEANARMDADATLTTNLGTETFARIQGDSDLSNAIANTVQGLTDETNARVAADGILTTDIANTNANAVVLQTRVGIAEANILAEANARTNADAALSTRIDNNANAITGLDGRVTILEAEANDSNSALLAEVVARIAGDNDLQANITIVANDLSSFEAATTANFVTVANEIAATNSDVANAQTEINAIEVGAGLQDDGTYVANIGATYISGATSLFDADNMLDNAVASLATELATLSQDTIKTTDGLNMVHVADQSVVTSLRVVDAAAPVVTVTASDTTDSNLVMDLTQSGEVKLAAMGSGANVDLRLTAQGAGHVIVGETGVGVIQAEDGYSLTVAGGTGAALNLIGSTVNVQSDSGSNVAVFSAAAGSTAYTTVVAGNTNVTFATVGASTDIDLVLNPQGAGTVDVSMSRVVNVANATSANDAVNLAQLTDAISTADVGMVKTLVANLPATAGTVTLGTITGTVLSSRVLILNAYAPGATIVVGSAGGNDIAASTDIDESAAGIYLTETASDYVATAITATLTGGDGLTGAAKIIVEYLTA